MKNNLDKSISLAVLTISGLAIILWFYNYYLGSDSFILLKEFNVNSLLSWGVNNSDLLIIFYIFLCLQLAGLSEFKQRQDYLVVAFISLIFTPIGLLFIKDETDKDETDKDETDKDETDKDDT